jgi:hypothetical protein
VPSSRRTELTIVAAFCALAGLRVFLFDAAFPFFNNVDEQAHVDLVFKYARGHAPAGLETFDREAIEAILLYGSPEYTSPPGFLTRETMPEPVWRRLANDPNRDRVLDAYAQKLSKNVNHESMQPPLYYAVAGAWLRIGEALGLRGGSALYWIRFLNVPLIALLTWMAYVFARTFFPGDSFLALGMPLLTAFVPTDTFYSVNNDVLLPVVGGGAMICLLRIARGDSKSYAFHVLAGLLVAGCLMVKLSSVAIVPVAVAAAWFGGRPWGKAASLLAAAAAVPVVWGARNLRLVGDVTASAPKLAILHWTVKPLAGIWSHPVFSIGGAATFWHETMAHFWRGELAWGLTPMAIPGVDMFYGASSAVLLLACTVALAIGRKTLPRDRQVVDGLNLAAFAGSIFFLLAVSVRYDFDGCVYPSSAHPFLTSGRLALAVWLPFAALYVGGLSVLLPGRRLLPARWAVLAGIVALITLSETSLSRVVFESGFNWFHMR